MIKILDYGVGNVRAFLGAFHRLDLPAEAVTSAAGLQGASRLILPGVGAFDQAMAMLNASGMRAALDDLVHGRNVPLLGVCVGMQMLAQSSSEGACAGLGWIPGDVRSLAESCGGRRLPHMGWNTARPVRESALTAGLADSRFYFLHTYVFDPACDDATLAVTDYGSDFPSIIQRDNIFGVQFHPEKSHEWGAQLLRNFATMPSC